ncbi:MAG: ribosome maturation factor RimP [Clostridia bacterium]|nr:ribosome maturation factor RimP [Clostridia bacterium]
MKREDIELKVEELLTPYCNEHGYEIVEVEYVKEGSDYILRVYAEKEGGITINDCVEISRYIDPILDSNDILDNEYRLQVSSPGLDRTLKKEKDFVRYQGRIVELKTFDKVDGTKEHEGTLKGLIDGAIVLDEDGNEKSYKQNEVALVKLKVIF